MTITAERTATKFEVGQKVIATDDYFGHMTVGAEYEVTRVVTGLDGFGDLLYVKGEHGHIDGAYAYRFRAVEPELKPSDLRVGDRVYFDGTFRSGEVSLDWHGWGTVTDFTNYVNVNLDSGGKALLHADEIDLAYDPTEVLPEAEVVALPTIDTTAGLRSLGEGAVIRSTVTGLIVGLKQGKWRALGNVEDFTPILSTVVGVRRVPFEVLAEGE